MKKPYRTRNWPAYETALRKCGEHRLKGAESRFVAQLEARQLSDGGASILAAGRDLIAEKRMSESGRFKSFGLGQVSPPATFGCIRYLERGLLGCIH